MKPPTNDIIPQSYKMTELGSLPEEWEVVRLGEYCNVFSGYAFKSDDFCNNGVLVVKIGNLQNGSIVFNTKESFFPREKINDDISKFILNEGDILIALTGATTGKISLVPKSVNGALLNQRVGKFSFYNDSLYKSFVMYYFMTNEFQNHIKKNILQSAQGNISPKQIETFLIPLPPLLEQQKIAVVLSAVQEAKEKTQAVIAAIKALKKSMMKHLFTYGPVSPQEAENVPLKETEIGMVPEEWDVVRLGDVVIKNKGIQRGPWGGSIKKEIFVPVGYAVYEQGNVISGNITDFRYFIDKDKFEELKNFKVKAGDILITAAGTLGKLVILPNKIHEGVINQALIIIRIDEQIINKIYFRYLFNLIVEQGIIASYSHGATLKNLSSIRVLRNIRIPLPPLPVQQKIASILSAIDEKIEAEENKKKALEELFKSLLHNLMTAKIRVNQLEISS